MKTFSVRFYKRLILVFLALLIVIPTIFAVFFGLRSASLEQQLAEGGLRDPETEASNDPEASRTPGVVPTSYDNTLEGEPLSYQTLYPELYGTGEVPKERVMAIDTVYLTFDSSLSEKTREIMDILDEYGIKGTFFVIGTTDPDALAVMKEIADRGHTIGLRSYSGSLQQVYQSVEAYLEDFKQIYDLVYETTGVKAEIFRFPSGSVNSYSTGIYQELNAEMIRRNFVFFDWNVNGENGKDADEISTKIIASMADKDRGIIKFRDTPENSHTTLVLRTVIDELRGLGYEFAPLTAQVMPVIFSYESTS